MNPRAKSFALLILLVVAVLSLTLYLRRHPGGTKDLRNAVTARDAKNTEGDTVPLKPARVLGVEPQPLRKMLDSFSTPSASDLESAQRVYKSIDKCFKSARDADLADGQMRQAQMPNLTDQQKKEALARAEKFLKQSNEASTLCDGVAYGDLVDNVYPSLLRAAQLGDNDAALCYVDAPFPIRQETLRSQEETQSYQSNAWGFIQQGIERGDWRVIDMMLNLYGDSNNGKNWFFGLAQRDPVKYYQYARLLSLGASGEYRDSLGRIASLEATLIKPEDVANGDAFAQKMYQKYFSNNSPITKKPDYPCQFYFDG